MRPFSQELCEHTIDYVAEDSIGVPAEHYADLRACALTCLSWLSPARCHLYEHVELRLLESTRLFARTLTKSPNLCRLVKRLEFRFEGKDWAGQPSYVEEVPFPAHLIGGLVSLQELRFACCMDREGEHAAVQIGFVSKWTGCAQLRTLQLEHFAFDTLEELVRLVWSFPLLQELRLSQMAWYDRGGSVDPADFPGRCQHLTVVEVRAHTRSSWVPAVVPNQIIKY